MSKDLKLHTKRIITLDNSFDPTFPPVTEAPEERFKPITTEATPLFKPVLPEQAARTLGHLAIDS